MIRTPTLHRVSLLATLSISTLVLAGCVAELGLAPSDLAPTGTYRVESFDELDQNGDGDLDADDLEEGQAAIFAVATGADGEVVELALVTEEAFLVGGGATGHSYLWLWLTDAPDSPLFTLHVDFEAEQPLPLGSHQTTGADTMGQFSASADLTGVAIQITRIGEGTASGWLDPFELQVREDPGGEPTGESVEILAIGFNSLPVTPPPSAYPL